MRVTLTGLGHRFAGQPWLFRGLDALLRPGEVTALTGPSGSGKSTLLNLIAGWADPAEGIVVREGVDRIGWVFQNPFGPPRRTALDLVAYPLLARGTPRATAAEEALGTLDRFGLAALADREFRSLSGGEAQRLMLARAIAAGPELLLIDEPTAQLDPVTADTVNAVIGRLAEQRTIIVIATHDPRTRDACTAHVDLGERVAGDRAERVRVDARP
ncbi:ATP-binding cassette domain-containing protein [Agromyces archimandritae]|uniref:ATP-binding cassette domain-containing protein n=1 Tax=Agromyces archimandritae TaxID=2781962 RepID=A0A975FK45_9MICO|nr:ATP-binding cassette domain-containing protein [Agromyces archimandritae]QTX03534.1 ATP-binding cassette domain-containing protein [Agromyces archimandritae]